MTKSAGTTLPCSRSRPQPSAGPPSSWACLCYSAAIRDSGAMLRSACEGGVGSVKNKTTSTGWARGKAKRVIR